MLQLKHNKAAWWASLVALVSFVLQVFFPQYSIIDFGFILALLLTFFTSNRLTYIIAALSSLAVIASAFYRQPDLPLPVIISQDLFSLSGIVAATVLMLFLKKENKKIEKERRYYSNLFLHTIEGILLANEQGKIVQVNPAAESLFGYEENEMNGLKLGSLIPLPNREVHLQNHSDFFRNPKSVSKIGGGKDIFALRKDGSQFPVEISLNAFKNEEENFSLAFITDITLRRTAEQNMKNANLTLQRINSEMKKLNEALEEKVEERTLMLKEALHKLEVSLEKEKELSEIKSKFVSMASHEFRTPLSTVMFSASLLEQYTGGEEQVKRDKHIRKIKDSVNHLTNILNDFLNLGRLNEGKFTVKCSAFKVNEIAEETIEEMKSNLKSGQEIHCQISPETEMCCDPQMVKNIIINLLSNAIKYSHQGSSIWFKLEENHGKIQMIFKDEGIGIPAGDIPHLFSTFFRGSNVLTTKGTGLGLYIVKQYLDLLGGEIRVDSMEKKGTTVEVYIPKQCKIYQDEKEDTGDR